MLRRELAPQSDKLTTINLLEKEACMPKSLYITGATIADPVKDRFSEGDVYIEEDTIATPPSRIPADAEIIDAQGLLLVPALTDLHVHLREPGGEASETIATGCRAAAAGGFGTIVPMPNTKPPIDTVERLRWQIETAERSSAVEVCPSACISIDRKGRHPTDMESLAANGAAFFTDDGSTVSDDSVMREAMHRAAALGLAVVDHAQRSADERVGVMHAGRQSESIGLPGIPTEAETEIIARDIELSEETGCAIHIQHITSGAGADLVRQAKARGVKVTAELTPHHLVLCDQDVTGDDANFKMNPPLRTSEDRAALRAALLEGVIDCFATDHAPHALELKQRGFIDAPFGVVGLETAIGVTYTALVETGMMSVLDWIKLWTVKPARIINRDIAPIEPGFLANLVLIDTRTRWVVKPESLLSKSKNTCFADTTIVGRAFETILAARGSLYRYS